MFHAQWILDDAAPAPDPRRIRRDALLTTRQAGRPIQQRWPIPSALRRVIGSYPRDVSALRFDDERATSLIDRLGGPGDALWAAAIVTMSEPSVVVPLQAPEAEPTARRLRLIRAFQGSADRHVAIGIDLVEHRAPRGARNWATASAHVVDHSDPTEFADRLQSYLAQTYLEADVNWRDRSLRADGDPEPLVLLVDALADTGTEARAAAATFGVGVIQMRENVARDARRLGTLLEQSAQEIAAAVLVERSGSGRLAWVGDQIRAKIDGEVERIDDPASVSDAVRSLLSAMPGPHPHSSWRSVPTCARCQPGAALAVASHGLAVHTVEAKPDELCICRGGGGGNVTIALGLAASMTEAASILVIGFQSNFDEILSGVRTCDVEHLFRAGDATAAARRASLAVVLPGSMMGHSDSEPYLTALEKEQVRILRAEGSQVRDLIRALFRYATDRHPELKRENPRVAGAS